MQRIEAIVLAGGLGSRFGGGKLLAPYGDGLLLYGAVRAAMAAPVKKVILVTGSDEMSVGQAAKTLAEREYPSQALEIVHADRYVEGMAATLRSGVSSLYHATEGAFVFLGDMPRVPLSIGAKLASSIGDSAAAAPVFQGTRGHPVLFSARLFPSLLALEGDHGARVILDALSDDLKLVTVEDDGVLFDVDRRSDLTL